MKSIVLLILAASAPVQVGSVRALPAATTDATMPKAQELFDFAACLVKQAPRQAKSLMESDFDSAAESRIATEIARGHNACVKHGVLSARPGEMRGAIAEALFKNDPQLLPKLASLPAEPPIRATAGKGERPFLISYGTCLVDADPGHAAALLQTPFADPTERAAFLAFGSDLKDCMAFKVRYHVDVADMRNQIAAIAYRRVTGMGAGSNKNAQG